MISALFNHLANHFTNHTCRYILIWLKVHFVCVVRVLNVKDDYQSAVCYMQMTNRLCMFN